MIDSLLKYLPDDLLRKLREIRPFLERTGGSIRPRRRDGVYCIRIRADDPDRGRVHRRITLGDEGAAYAAQALIDAWRREYDARQAKEERKREEERVYKLAVKGFRRALLAQAAGPSQRRRLAREFDKAAKNPMDLYIYLLAGGNLPEVPRRPGPKPPGGLC